MKRTKKINLLLFFVLGSLMIGGMIQCDVDKNRSCFNIRYNMLNFLNKELLFEKNVLITKENTIENRSVIYVLGGGQDSLHTRFLEASILYHKGLSRTILILSRPGTTEYYIDIGRNLTNDEWSVRELERFDVRKEDIELIRFPLGVLGTANEATNLPGIVQGKGFDRLILVTSSYHTKRAFTAFSHFASDRPVALFMYGAEDNAGLSVLLEEYIKLFLYEKIVLPVYGMAGQGGKWNSAESRGKNVGK